MVRNNNMYDVVPKSPVVYVFGHVGHGKTSLINSITKTNPTSLEPDCIIRYHKVSTFKHKGMKLTFIDDPDYLLLRNMCLCDLRTFGIAVLIVSLQDGPELQTLESAKQIKQYGLPTLIAYNKLDCGTVKMEENISKTRSELTKIGIVPEIIGGNTTEVLVSAKSNENVKLVLNLLCSMANESTLMNNLNSSPIGIILEINLINRLRTVANVLVVHGLLKHGAVVILGVGSSNVYFKRNTHFTTTACIIELTILPTNIEFKQHIETNRCVPIPIKQVDVHSYYRGNFLVGIADTIIKANMCSSFSEIIGLINELTLKVVTGIIEYIWMINVVLMVITKSTLMISDANPVTSTKCIAKRPSITVFNPKFIYMFIQWLETLTTRPQLIIRIEKIFRSQHQTVYGTKLICGEIHVNQRLVLIREEQPLSTVRVKTLKRFCTEVKLFNEVNQLFGLIIHENRTLRLNDKLTA
ncbi:Translation initiation factor IF-2 [Candidatus Hodgkinia cicadicola]|uniref:Translation initiation factor IF-2 n=1 Tax=Candidatus Hodgkinia cicadicola TaxID=573658 RepID=A0ABX4MFE8_9HYPH|nr:Translation initiation factor IF-2 [Candidatus Hodgkinia cicadicola]